MNPRRAGVATKSCDIEHLHVASDGRVSYEVAASSSSSDHDVGTPAAVRSMWKLYPYEWLAEEELGAALEGETYARNATSESGCVWMEPPWKLVLSNKVL